MKLKIGTRSSSLALWQAKRVKVLLEAHHRELACEIVPVQTDGDRDKATPLTILGGQGVFVKELQRAVSSGEVDCAVHSLKDLPTTRPEELLLAAVPERDDPRDILIAPVAGSLDDLHSGARMGTSSRRRAACLLSIRSDIELIDLRGNVDTRLRKVLKGSPERYDAAILAAAGVTRMGRQECIREYLDPRVFTPSPGQGALAIEVRRDDQHTQSLVQAINDPDHYLMTAIEREFLRGFGAGCQSPVGALAFRNGSQVRLRVMAARENLAGLHRRSVDLRIGSEIESANRLASEMLARVGG